MDVTDNVGNGHQGTLPEIEIPGQRWRRTFGIGSRAHSLYVVTMALTLGPDLRYVGMCIGDENIWVSCAGIPLPERQPRQPSAILRLIKRLKKPAK